MLRLFDSVFLCYESHMSAFAGFESILISETLAEAEFEKDLFDLSTVIDFLTREKTFRGLLEEHHENSVGHFFKTIVEGAKGEPFYICTDEKAFNDILLSYYRACYPQMTADEAFVLYTMVFDKIQYRHPEFYEMDARLAKKKFDVQFEATKAEPLDERLIGRLPLETLLGHYLATEMDESFLPKLENALRLATDEFLWTNDVVDYRKWVLSGFYDIGDLEEKQAPDLDDPSLKKYFKDHSSMKFFAEGKRGEDIYYLKRNYRLGELTSTNFKQQFDEKVHQKPDKTRRLLEACLSGDTKMIIEADIASGWGSHILSDSKVCSENHLLFVSYLYRCWKEGRKDLLQRYKLPVALMAVT